MNADAQGLLDWVVDRVYTGSKNVAESCFMAIVTIFNARFVRAKNSSILVSATGKLILN